ncbi:TetR/AcrR family transcriptional regulator [Phaeovulum sp. W22_SRMD_FR3]|uniref:TetR/AcrR family transcriptional regulator n=1 Tax=Phaeovulum sp. W22_SRMD_FR3 TaxID=3240274 RepID=UPI003F9A47CA
MEKNVHEMIDYKRVAAVEGMEPAPAADRRAAKDSEATKSAILTAATYEFSEFGVSGARIDRIAARANANKSLIYSYFGDKEELYKIVLRSAYIQIRMGERELDLSSYGPVEGVLRLVEFTFDHYNDNPWFLRLLAEENLRRGATVSQIGDIRQIQSQLTDTVSLMLEKGHRDGIFTREISATSLYLLIASLFYFPMANRYTLSAVFGVEADSPAWSAALLRQSQDIVLAYLCAPASGAATDPATPEG